MKRWLLAGVAALLGLSLIGYAVLGRQTDEERIAALLDHLRKAIHLDEPQGNPIMRQARLDSEYKTIFSPTVTYEFPELAAEAAWRQGIAALTVRGSMSFDSLDVEFTAVRIDVQPSGTSATVASRAVLTGARGGRPEHDERKVVFDFGKTDGSWLIGHFRVWPGDDTTIGTD